MRVGFIGAGLQGERRALALLGQRDVKVSVVSATDLAGAQPLAARLGCEAAAGWQTVVERDDLDAVVVCTPPDSHATISIAAMRAGMHVLCEKPLARRVEEAEAMLAVAEETRRTLKCGFNHRHHPGIQQIRHWYDEGRIGEPFFVRARYGIGGRPGYEQEWRADPAVAAGGQLMEQGIHAIDLARWFLGEFAQVAAFVATQFWKMSPLEDNGFALYHARNGATASIHSSLTQWTSLFSFEIGGRDGSLEVQGLGGSYGTERAILGRRDFAAPFSEEIVEFRGGDRSWLGDWNEFVAAIREEREPLGSARDGLEAMRLVLAAYQAATTQKVVDL